MHLTQPYLHLCSSSDSKLNPCLLPALISRLVTLTMYPLINGHAIICCHTPTQSPSSLPCQKPNPLQGESNAYTCSQGERWPMHPVPTMPLSKPSLAATLCMSTCGWLHPPPLVIPPPVSLPPSSLPHPFCWCRTHIQAPREYLFCSVHSVI